MDNDTWEKFTYDHKKYGDKIKRVELDLRDLELRLYKDSLSLMFQTQKKILKCNLKYIGYSFKPMIIMILPLALILIHLHGWFGYESFKPGQNILLKIKVANNTNLMNMDLDVETSSGLKIETPPLRIQEEREIDWRIAIYEPGMQSLTLSWNNQKVSKRINVSGKPLIKLAPVRITHGFLDELLNPGEAPIKNDIPFKSIEVNYPLKRMDFIGWNLHWIIVYILLSIIFGFSFKGILKVQM